MNQEARETRRDLLRLDRPLMALLTSLKRSVPSALKLLAALVPLGITAVFADSVVRGGTDRSAAAIVTWLLPISAFVVFILRRRSPVCYGCCAAGWLYFLSPLLAIVPPLWYVYVYVFPSA